MPSSFSNSQSSACMRGSSPCQKEQKGSSESSVCKPSSPVAPRPRAAGGGSYTRSTSQSEQRVNPGRYSALHWGQNMVKRSLLHQEIFPHLSKIALLHSVLYPFIFCCLQNHSKLVGVSTRSVKGFNASPPTCVFSAR